MKFLVFPIAVLCLVPLPFRAAELTPEVAGAFSRYIADFEGRRLHAIPFLRAEEVPLREHQLKNGEVVVFPAQCNGETEVKGGLIHDWIGTVFIPATTLDRVLSVLQDYGRDKEFYAPDIADSKIRARKGANDFEVYMRVVKSKFLVTDVLNTEHEIHYSRVDPDRAFCRSYSTRIAEVSNPGTSHERELPVGKDRGLLWRMYGYWFFEQRDNGVYVEYESITLSRDIPFGMGKVLGPILHNVPAESLRSSLAKTRSAVSGSAEHKAD